MTAYQIATLASRLNPETRNLKQATQDAIALLNEAESQLSALAQNAPKPAPKAPDQTIEIALKAWVKDRATRRYTPDTVFETYLACDVSESIASYGYGTFTSYNIGRALQRRTILQLISINKLPGRVTSYTFDFSLPSPEKD